MRNHRLIYIAAIVLVIAHSVPAQREKSALMSAEQAKHMHPPTDALPVETWKPSTDQIAQMERNFGKLKTLKPDKTCCRNQKGFVFEPEDYYMQYAAIIFEGRRCIYINAFRNSNRRDWEKYWREELMFVKGGGTDYWQALYDPEIEVFSRLTFNSDE